jgi:hypothetical protein
MTTQIEKSWTGSAWENDQRTTYTYDGENHVTEKLEENWNGSSWVNFRRTQYTYVGGRLDQDMEQSWTGSAWQNEKRQDYTYDAAGKLTQADRYDYTGGINPVLEDRWTWAYDADGRVLSETKEHDSGSGLANSIRYVYTYVAGTGQLDLQTIEFWSMSAWNESIRSRYSYGSDGRISQMEISTDGGTTWAYRSVMAYDGWRLVTETMETWNGSGWDPSGRNQYGWGSAFGRVLPEHSDNNPLRLTLFRLYGEEINRYLGM